MSSLAITARPRRLLAKLHRWSGLALLVFLFIAGLTGSVLAFRWEIDALLNPDLFRVPPGERPLPHAALIARFEAENPDLLVSSLTLPQAPDQAMRLAIKSRMEAHAVHKHVPGMKATAPFNQAFINPYTGITLGKRNTTDFRLDRRNFVPFVLRLHYSLFLEKWGVWLMGGCAVVWFISSLLGMALSWPAAGYKMASWKPILTLRWRQGGYKLNYDLHRIAGILTFPILVVVAFTAIYLNLPDLVKPAIGYFSPLGSNMQAPSQGKVDPTDTVITSEQAIAVAGEVLPSAKAVSISRDFNKGLYTIRLRQPDDVSQSGDNWVFIGMRDGRTSYQRLARERSSGDIFAAWQLPLHGGTAFGVVGQVLICLSAVTLCLLCVTGLNVWMRKHRSERRAQANRKA